MITTVTVAELMVVCYSLYDTEKEYIFSDSQDDLKWRYDIMFFLINCMAIDIYLILQYLYIGVFKKTDVVAEAGH